MKNNENIFWIILCAILIVSNILNMYDVEAKTTPIRQYTIECVQVGFKHGYLTGIGTQYSRGQEIYDSIDFRNTLIEIERNNPINK